MDSSLPMDRRTLRARYLMFVKVRCAVYDLDIDEQITPREKEIAIKHFIDKDGSRSWVDVRKMSVEEILDQLYEDMEDWIKRNS